MKKIPVRQITASQPELPSKEQFKIRRVEDIMGDTGLFQDLHRHDFFFILALQIGKGNHEIDFTNYKVLNNTVFFLRPGQVHKLQLKKGCKGYLVEFNTEFYYAKQSPQDQWLRKAANKNYCQVEKDRFNKLQVSLASMFHEYTSREEGYQNVVRSYLDIFLIEFSRQSAMPAKRAVISNSYTQERFETFTALLDKHIATHKQVSQYTGLMNLSSYQLNDITKSSIGKTASELINDHILLEAKRLLLATTNQVKEIAGNLGYEDASYFIRFFKKHTGYSPETFRHHFK